MPSTSNLSEAMKPVLAVLSEFEKAHFFPGGVEKAFLSRSLEFDLIPAGDEAVFQKKLDAMQPEIVLAAWDSPPLPLDRVKGRRGSVEYLAYLSGTPRKKITQAHLDTGLRVTNWGDAIGPYVGECALLLILATLRQLSRYSFELKSEGKWRERLTQNRSLFGKRVGFRGFGSIAQHLARLMKPFSPVMFADTGVPEELLAEFGVGRAESTDWLFENSDVLVELKPLTDKTRASVNERLLRKLPEGACFVNLGRGSVVVEEDLIKVAREGRISVGLDVYDVEPLPPESELRQLRNVVLFPHMGGATIDRGIHCGDLALDNIGRFLKNEPLVNEVDARAFANSSAH